MAQIVRFPKEPRSDLEKEIRSGIAQAALTLDVTLPGEITDQVAKNVVLAAEQWSTDVKLSFEVPAHLDEEGRQQIARIVELAVRETELAFRRKAMGERIRSEMQRALAEWT